MPEYEGTIEKSAIKTEDILSVRSIKYVKQSLLKQCLTVNFMNFENWTDN